MQKDLRISSIYFFPVIVVNDISFPYVVPALVVAKTRI
jgi:hypothetical protein